MLNNSSMTLYRKNKDGCLREFVEDIMWQEGVETTVTQQGIISEDMVEVFIPFDGLETPPKKGDILVKGECDYPLSMELASNLKAMKKAEIDFLMVFSVTFCDFGSPNMRHWEVKARWG